jgi:hypothetical protein
MQKLTPTDLVLEDAELLPARDTLVLNFNWANVVAMNSSNAVNIATACSTALSSANQTIVVAQIG